MAEKLLMLALSPTMETGTIVQWNKDVGDEISSGDKVCEVETDKATMDYEALVEGTLLKKLKEKGDEAEVGEAIGVVGEEGEDISDILEEGKAKEKPKKKKEPEEEEKPSKEPEKPEKKEKEEAEGEEPPGGVKASPLARKIAKEKGVDISQIEGTGPGGRVVKKDVEAFEEKPKPGKKKAPEAGERIKISKKRKIIAKRLSESKFTAPHYYLRLSVNMEEIIDSRMSLNAGRSDRISMNAFLIKFTAEALKRHPIINSTWEEDEIVIHPSIDIGLAVAQEDGLIVPVVRDCVNKGIVQIDKELRELVKKAKEGALKPEEYTGATFTISNLGSYGIEEFTAIINPPASAILAVGMITDEPVVVDDEHFVILPMMKMTMSCDHRVIDGATGAEFLKDLKDIMEEPMMALY